MKRINSEALQIARHINLFLNNYIPSQKSCSPHTLRSYKYTLSLYIGFLETEKEINSVNLRSDCFNQIIIEEWLIWLMEKRKCCPGTCNNRLASMRAFLKYLGSREVSLLYLYEEALRIKRKKEVRKPVIGMSKNGVKALLSVPNQKTKTGRRDLVFIILIYSTAARIDEILSLKVKFLFLDVPKPYITIIGKGNKIRTLYLLPKAVVHLKKYMEEFHLQTNDTEAYVFYSRNIGVHGKLSQTAMSKRIKIHAKNAHEFCKEVPLDLHAHQLRHAKASHWLEDGMNIVQISFLLGHKQLQTTMVYLDITIEQEAKALATLESESEKKLSKKWKNNNSNLSDFCGVFEMER
ncbi:MAG: tyrosine-type recombinase/integrase [Clostridiales bacterium]|nr:tyrosine-type recombinase/integrase [Clostridiales bacterium]